MWLLALACAPGFGCTPHGSLGRDHVGGTAGSSTGSEAGTAASSESTGGATANDVTTAAEGSSGSTTVAGGSSSDGGTTGVDLCAPAADDDACLACRKQGCCVEWTACAGDEICTCIATCIADGGDATACETVHCAGPNDPWTHLHQCSATECALDC